MLKWSLINFSLSHRIKRVQGSFIGLPFKPLNLVYLFPFYKSVRCLLISLMSLASRCMQLTIFNCSERLKQGIRKDHDALLFLSNLFTVEILFKITLTVSIFRSSFRNCKDFLFATNQRYNRLSN